RDGHGGPVSLRRRAVRPPGVGQGPERGAAGPRERGAPRGAGGRPRKTGPPGGGGGWWGRGGGGGRGKGGEGGGVTKAPGPRKYAKSVPPILRTFAGEAHQLKMRAVYPRGAEELPHDAGAVGTRGCTPRRGRRGRRNKPTSV